MRRISELIKYEIFKQYKKLSIKIILLIILISSVALPIGGKILVNKFDEMDFVEDYKRQIEYIDYSLKDIEKSDSSRDKLRRRILQGDKEKFTRLVDNNIPKDDWRYLNNEEADLRNKESIALEFILSGYEVNVIIDNFSSDFKQFIGSYSFQDEDVIKKKIDEVKRTRDILVEGIAKNDYFKYLKDSIGALEREVKDKQEVIDSLEKQLKSDVKNENLKIILGNNKKQLEYTQNILNLTRFRYDNKIPYDNNDWKHNTIIHIKNQYNALTENIQSEEVFKEQQPRELESQISYETYKKQFEARMQKVREKIEIDWYSLKNNIPQLEFSRDARTAVEDIYLSFIPAIIVICIIIAGGIVSSEFSKGTIRLLMIRPVKRWKLLLSKFLSVLIIGYGLLAITFIVIIITNGIIYGFNGYLFKVLTYNNLGVIEHGYISYILPKILFASIGLIFMIALAFFISTVSKNTALSVGFPIVLYMASIPITIIMLQLKMKWITKTFMPYIHLGIYEGESLYVNIIKDTFRATVNPTMGAIQLVILSVLLIGIAFIIFIKRDIQN